MLVSAGISPLFHYCNPTERRVKWYDGYKTAGSASSLVKREAGDSTGTELLRNFDLRPPAKMPAPSRRSPAPDSQPLRDRFSASCPLPEIVHAKLALREAGHHAPRRAAPTRAVEPASWTSRIRKRAP